jgi:AraC family transcriptional regulator of adaptative response/methylated-DNA-[protein]-cysteine methyltransferase
MIFSAKFNTPLGDMTACSANGELYLLKFGDTDNSDFKGNSGEIKFEPDGCISELRKQLNEYFEGSRKNFSIPLILNGTPFQNKVWKTLLDIPYGVTRSYAEQAILTGNPYSIRAVAKANGSNQIAILIPCHRVIGSDGRLTGYAGGLERKKWLLEHEYRFSGKEYAQSLFPDILEK